MITNVKLNHPGSGKETRHFELSLDSSSLSYQVGDALGVWPANCPELVEDILAALHRTGEEVVPGKEGEGVPLREALLRHYELGKITRPLLEAIAVRSGDETLRVLTGPNANGELATFLWGRQIVDLLLTYSGANFAAAEFVGLLAKLRPRLYSISSSANAHPGKVHLTVAVLRYQSFGRPRKGVCSTFLAERARALSAPVFVQPNHHFRPPPSGDTPMIMVGPGTGIAPFRGFLEERRCLGARGRNWLFFGEQHAATDFLYREELESMLHQGTLARLDTAFSRDQERKVYVQDRMIEHARELYDWLEQGAHFYVCGDARRMARDVDQALHAVIAAASGRTREQAEAYVAKLRAERRYQRDVY